MGNLLAVVVHAANIHDTKAGIWAAKKAFETYPSIQRFCADAGYRETFEQDVSNALGLAWINNSCRLSKDYEISLCSAQAVCTIAAFRTLLKRF